jgi:hypothetical protein
MLAGDFVEGRESCIGQKRSKCGQLFFCKSVHKEREAVVIPLPISMHTGQIIMMSKMFAEVDLGFYDFVDAVPVLKWKRAQ